MTTQPQQRPPVEMSRKMWDEYGYVAWARKATQDTAGYNALGGTDTQACANCQFFMSPNRCTVVEDWPVAISPTGLSRYWTAIKTYKPEPIKVIIVEDDATGKSLQNEKGLWGVLRRAAAGFFGGDAAGDMADTPAAVIAPPPTEWKDSATGFKVFEDTTGALRWLAWVSNNFKDREGEIFEDAAHREFVAYLDGGGAMPEAWLWHTPGTRWGQADFADYSDGFLIMSGTVDAGHETTAKSLAGEADALGVSHGFRYRYSNKQQGYIGWYRTFEVSPLPLSAAANAWTGMQVIKEDSEMNAAKQQWLEGKLGKERVAQLVADRADLSKALADAGIDSKGMPDDDAAPAVSAKEIAEAAAKAITEMPAWKRMEEMVTAAKANSDPVPAMAQQVGALEARIKALEASDDEKIANMFAAKSTPGQQPGYRATTAEKTVLGENEADKALGGMHPDNSWLRQAVGGVVGG